MIRFLLTIILSLAASPAVATDESIATSGGLTIAPFAVPVAVPVAVVQRPAVFYGVSAYAPQLKTPPVAAQSSPSATTAPVDDPLRVQVAPILQRRCAECHQGPQAQGSFLLFDADGRLLDKLPRHLVVEQATSATVAAATATRPAMPPGERAPLTSDEQELVRRWGKLPKRLSY